MPFLSEMHHFVKGIDPVADAFSGTVTTEVVNMKNYGRVTWVIYKGVGLTGTSTITVEACSNKAASVVSAVPFKYRAITTGDTMGALLDATAAGFTTTAGSSQLYVVGIDEEALAASGYNYVRLKAVEVVDSPVLGGILCITSQPRFDSADTAIV